MPSRRGKLCVPQHQPEIRIQQTWPSSQKSGAKNRLQRIIPCLVSDPSALSVSVETAEAWPARPPRRLGASKFIFLNGFGAAKLAGTLEPRNVRA